MRFILCFLLISATSSAQTLLVNQGSNWKYFDQGNLSGSQWTLPAFDDNAWAQGNAELGYGDGDEATVVSYGSDPGNKYLSTYFRKNIFVTNISQFSHLTLNLKRDDGAVVYLNGIEVWRSNMPGGSILATTTASGTVAWPFENDWYTQDLSASLLNEGNNTIAVEIHQDEASSSDISFNLSLIGNFTLNANVVRGPYLQKATQSSVILRWRTDAPTDTRVNFGISPVSLNSSVVNAGFTTDHEVELTGLNPGSSYFYEIGSFSSTYFGTGNTYFSTLPATDAEAPYQFLVLGDCGTGQQEQIDVKNAVVSAFGQHFDGVLLLGDNAYQSGFDDEYQSNFFNNKYNEIFENTVIWPAPGNHDYNNHIPFSPAPAYYNIFNCPTNGESGGVPSGTEKYYSFDHGNIHFVSLDSYDEPLSASAQMATWLSADLAANDKEWLIAFWHHPPYTKGSHDSDNPFFLDGELVDMREQILPILENYGVDLVLNGHSHSYERSMLIDGHYGYSNSFGPQHIMDSGSGDFPTDCPYEKMTTLEAGHQGTVYCVMGNSGKTSSTASGWPHPIMYSYTASEVGAILLDVEANRLDATLITGNSAVFDHFTIVKNAGLHQTIEACMHDEIELHPSWPMNNTTVWNPGNIQAPTYTITALSNGQIEASDLNACINDVFTIVALQNDTCGYLESNEETMNLSSAFSVNYTNGILTILQPVMRYTSFEVFDLTGRLIRVVPVDEPEVKTLLKLPSFGYYFIRPRGASDTKRILSYE